MLELLIISILPLILNAKNRLMKNYVNVSKIFNLRNLRNNYTGIEWIVKNKKGNKIILDSKNNNKKVLKRT